MKKGTLLALLLLSLTTISTIMPLASATSYAQVGVHVGDTADYNYTSPTANGTVTATFHIQILQISGTSVTISEQEVYLGNTLGPDTSTGDISATYNTVQQYLVPANLNPGDNIFAGEWLIDNTTTMTVAGQNRTVNHFEYIGIMYFPMIRPGENFSYSDEAYYDKITGLLVQGNITVTGGLSPCPNGTKGSYIKTLTSTTAFTSADSAEPTTGVVLQVTTGVIALIAVTIIAATISSHKRLKTTAN